MGKLTAEQLAEFVNVKRHGGSASAEAGDDGDGRLGELLVEEGLVEWRGRSWSGRGPSGISSSKMRVPVLYVGANCPACETARMFLNLRGIAYEERSIEDPQVMRELLSITGKTTVPVLSLPDGDLLIGWDARRWIRRLDPEGVIVE